MAQRKRKHGRGGAPGAPKAGGTATQTPTRTEPPVAPTLSVLDTDAPIRFTRNQVRQAPVASKPVTQNEFLARYAARAQERDAEARAKLIPLKPGERPWPIVVSAIACAVLALANLVLFVAGVKVGHKPPGVIEVLAFVILMGVCGAGMWVLWYQAVLAFMVLLGIVIVYFCLFLVEASNVLAVVYPLIIIPAAGFMFWKLIRVLARLQMPERRQRTAQG